MAQTIRQRTRKRLASGLFALPERAAREGTLTEELFQAMRRLIAQGIWLRGDKLPGSRLLARDAKVSRTTVLAAIEMLVAERLLEARGRSGTYVAGAQSPAPDSMQGALPESFASNVAGARAFTVGAPGVDLFPLSIWRRLQAHRWRHMPLAALDDGDEAGWPELRAAIAAHVGASRGIKCRSEQVIVVTSAQSAIHLAAIVLAPPGTAVWMEEPGYFGTRSALLAAGMRPVAVPVDDEGINVEIALQLAPAAQIAVVTPSCQFPLGVRMSPDRRRQLLAWARWRNAWIVEDDYDSEFSFAKATQSPLAAMQKSSRVVHINTFGKTLFPTLRLAYLITPEALVDKFLAARRGIDRNATVPNQMVLADFLNKGQFARHLRRCRDAYRERWAAMSEGIAHEFGDTLVVPDQPPGLHICATFTSRCDDAEIAQLARRRGIVVEPLSRFFSDVPTRRGILLGFAGFAPNVIRRELRALASAIRPALEA